MPIRDIITPNYGDLDKFKVSIGIILVIIFLITFYIFTDVLFKILSSIFFIFALILIYNGWKNWSEMDKIRKEKEKVDLEISKIQLKLAKNLDIAKVREK